MLSRQILLLSTLLCAAASLQSCAVSTEEIAVISVRDYGEIRFRFRPELAPRHVEAFIELARSGFYDGTTFHRVLGGLFIQGGDPNSRDDDETNDGLGGPGYTLKAEFSDEPHRRGTVSMARKADDDSAGSQFFIVVSDHENWKKMLDGQFTVFGEVIAGIEVANRISRVEKDIGRNHRPIEDVVMESVRIEASSR